MTPVEGKALSPALEARIFDAYVEIVSLPCRCDASESVHLHATDVERVLRALVSEAQREQREADARKADKIAQDAREAAKARAHPACGDLLGMAARDGERIGAMCVAAVIRGEGGA